jgi:peptide/nickel transport system permease protein
MPVIFLTDGLIFLLLLMVTAFIWYARRHEHLRVPWRQVGRNGMAMSAVVVLLFYIIIGLLDSMHFHPRVETQNSTESRYSNEIISVLDVLLKHLPEQTEKTYSAPFATHAYAMETIDHEDGTRTREYPRLQHGGTHLDDPENRGQDILLKSLPGIAAGLLVWMTISFMIVMVLARNAGVTISGQLRYIVHRQTALPWHTILLTLGAVLVLFVWAFYLSHYYHIFGTDKVGQDVFYQAIKSIRTGLMIGTLTTLVMLPFALMLGVMAGYFRGWVDDIIQYIYTTLNSIPGVLLIAAAILMLEVYMSNHSGDFSSNAHRADLRLFFLCVILGIMSWTGLCRLLRGETMKLREIDYVQAAQAFGVSHVTIMIRHLLPNVMHIVMITIVLDFSALVLAEAVLAYINIGVDPSMSSWGNMINSARLEMAREPVVWWSLSAAFVFMLGLVLAANLFADAVRDAFDPRIREY